MPDFSDRIRRLPDDMVAALSFFSRLPVQGARPRTLDLRETAGAWPLAGLLIAVAPALVLVIDSVLGLPLLVTAFFVVATSIAMTGALHEDGLADTFDGLAHGEGRYARLEIMRDSRIGTFGALALLLSVGLKGAAIAALSAYPSRAVLAILCAAVISRTLALWHWSGMPPARDDGMAYGAGQPDTIALQIGLLSGLGAAIVLIVGFGWAAILGLIFAATAIGFYSPLISRRLGGHTGDTIGACQQIAETMLLAGLSSLATTIPA